MTIERPTPPVDPTRRRLLTIAAAASVVGIPTSESAAGAVAGLIPDIAADPIHAAIERHRSAAAIWDAAVDVWAKFPDGPKPMPIERRIERERINDAWRDARDALNDAGVDLINTSPTTLHGIARALNFIREQMVQEEGVYIPTGLALKGSDDPEMEIIAWIDAFLGTIEHAARELDLAGKAVQP